ncbi:M56 family metallopeptidase [Paenibacillus sp. CN-4]|uniref:M56 family metallopeptidase n=1 Tax=Paenibacillus nanchangensis TaxID=3348343 RepID=UPI003979EFF1
MTDLFLTVLNMSITASYVIAGIVAVRLFYRRLPKLFAYALWLPVWIRLTLPVSFTSAFSLLGLLGLESSSDTGRLKFTGITGLSHPPADLSGTAELPAAGPFLSKAVPDPLPKAVLAPFPEAAHPLSPWMHVLPAASCLWLIGCVILLGAGAVSYIRINRQVRTAVRIPGYDNVYETDRIDGPFILGWLHPKIYVPVGVPLEELSLILAHERTHINRRDYLLKPAAYAVLAVHWFNPLVWFAFFRMSRDMEMACDESVLRQLGSGVKTAYSKSLLSFASRGSRWNPSGPPAFGTSQAKSRIQNVLKYRKPRFAAAASAYVLTIVCTAGFLANPGVTTEAHLAVLGDYSGPVKLTSPYGIIQVPGDQLKSLLDTANWKPATGRPNPSVSADMILPLPGNEQVELRLYRTEPASAELVDLQGGGSTFYVVPEKNYQQIERYTMASVWADALITRDGEPRYHMMSQAAITKFAQEQSSRSGENWNYNIGVSSPWAVGYEISLEGDAALITYQTRTSEPAEFRTVEGIVFGVENGRAVVADYETLKEAEPVKPSLLE